MGGYFISGGLERLIRILILQKRNYPMGMVRGAFIKRGAGYTDKAVVMRTRKVCWKVVTKFCFSVSCTQALMCSSRPVQCDCKVVLPTKWKCKARVLAEKFSFQLGLFSRSPGQALYYVEGLFDSQDSRNTEIEKTYDWNGVVISILQDFGLFDCIIVKTKDSFEEALIDTSDREIFASLTCCYSDKRERGKGVVSTQLIGERTQIILDEYLQALLFVDIVNDLSNAGKYFRSAMEGFEKDDYETVAEAVIKDYILVHLQNDNHAKFNLLIFMLQKLYALVDQTTSPDNPDALQFQEALLPGHLITVFLKDRIQDWLQKSKRLIMEEITKNKSFQLNNSLEIRKFLSKYTTSVGRAIETLIKVGRANSQSMLDLPQREGMTIQAERLNFHRYISHFRSVHRGSSFAKMRTTTVRKLLPESWGFLCPVHTPDGEPCGLLNHMTSICRISSCYNSEGAIKDFQKIKDKLLVELVRGGMIPLLPKMEHTGPPEILHVHLDGCIVGSIASAKIEEVVNYLRRLKLLAHPATPEDLEVGYVPLSLGGAYPGLYLFTSPARFVRPVKNLVSLPDGEPRIELIGPFEQAFMEIRCPDGGDGGRKKEFPATHEEIHPTAILSVVANLTPWSDHNQSPRNMYQCQMAKQTMGFCGQALKYRTDVKAFHLQTPQSPIVRTATYKKYHMDEFPSGTNAIVAVLSYTGYDMEDAMILNKSAVDRGMFRGDIFQTECIDLSAKRTENVPEIFAKSPLSRDTNNVIDSDGLPRVGETVVPYEQYYSIYNTLTGAIRPVRLKGTEPAVIDYVALNGTNSKGSLQKVNIRLRRKRNPIIGDKFSSRHGQKGVCSQLWPDIDMPFSANTGMRPDLIINPHAFPSRMTIAMLIESIAAKAGSAHGKFIDATPFASSVKEDGENRCKYDSIVDELGPMLASYGFNHHGTEVLYSGLFGTELQFEIFIGPVYYQRLRHMVSDKFQVRTTGRIDQVTKQPIGGRKHGGGIRFGEMERDALLAHGASYLLHDRLHTCSDYHVADVCSLCGSLLSATVINSDTQKKSKRHMLGLNTVRPAKNFACQACQTNKGMETVAMPYVFRSMICSLQAFKAMLRLTRSWFVANGRTYNYGYYLVDDIYPKWQTFVKPLKKPEGKKELDFHNAQAAAKKDVERASGILQAQFAIVRGPARFWNQKMFWYIMHACVIMHNMIIENEHGQDVDYSQYELLGYPVRVRRRAEMVARFVASYHAIRRPTTHIDLQKDLTDEWWAWNGR
ncbi:putative DNA-directed RNA polymerase I subunit RPA2 [Triticum urartu]|uniref:DNA-directed RNA polymerase subunit beta n=2 Tax=Triticum TaxID=4564 RepID=M7ZRZ1_TRIUA|nr:putative DNA-directed RNA polymerase I subunit RPA2 [Triticum urartu]